MRVLSIGLEKSEKICYNISMKTQNDNIEEKIEKLAAMLVSSRRIVFFGGAGVSTESGIPDFRSKDGLYNQKYDYPPEEILSHGFFYSHTADFFRFYRDKILLSAEPNAAHYALTLIQKYRDLTVVTQNIDGLHQKAGNKKVFELHGTVEKNHCVKCGRFFPLDYIKSRAGVPVCDECGGLVKPDVVLYGEGLDDETVGGALTAISRADLLIVAGTSLSVYPAAGFIGYYGGENSVIINVSPTAFDRRATLCIPAKVGEVLKKASESAFAK